MYSKIPGEHELLIRVFPGAVGKRPVEEVGKSGRGGNFHNVPFLMYF